MLLSTKLAALCATAFVIGVPAWLYANASRELPATSPTTCSLACDPSSGCEPCDPSACDPASCDPTACEPAGCAPLDSQPTNCQLTSCTATSVAAQNCDPAGCDPAACLPGACNQSTAPTASGALVEHVSFDVAPRLVTAPTNKTPCCADAVRESLKSAASADVPPQKK